MPRGPRLDAPGTLHHVMVRGIERRPIFQDDGDRADFLQRLAALAQTGAFRVYAWAFLPNHAHLLLRTGTRPLARSMRSLLTGYAGAFNRRHRRAGHLFQNRYKSIVVEEESYFLELVRYLHLNPLRTGVVPDLRSLARYPWSGHASLLSRRPHPWQDTQAVLRRFAPNARDARARYRAFVTERAGEGRRPELQGGGLVRSVGGWAAVQALRRGREGYAADERVLGSPDFVEELRQGLAAAREATRAGISLPDLVQRVCQAVSVRPQVLAGGSRRPAACRAREGIAYLWTEVCGQSGRQLALTLGVGPQSVYKAAERGRKRASGWERLMSRASGKR